MEQSKPTSTDPMTHDPDGQCEYRDSCTSDWACVLEVQLPDGPETFRVCSTCASKYAGRTYARIRRHRAEVD